VLKAQSGGSSKNSTSSGLAQANSPAVAEKIAGAASGVLLTAQASSTAEAKKSAVTKQKKSLGRSKASKGKASDVKKYNGAILLKFEDGSCRDVTCESVATTGQYCRMHYIKNWKKIKQREELMREGKLNRFIEELVLKYPDKYIEAIRHDLAHDQEFAKVVADLEIDEVVEASDDFSDDEDSAAENFIDHIRRDFGEGESEAF
jgi:hypothetical protein